MGVGGVWILVLVRCVCVGEGMDVAGIYVGVVAMCGCLWVLWVLMQCVFVGMCQCW